MLHTESPQKISSSQASANSLWGMHLGDTLWGSAQAPGNAATVSGTSVVRRSLRLDRSQKHAQPHSFIPKFAFAALYWRRSLKMPTFITDLTFMSVCSHIWVIAVSVVIMLWILQSTKQNSNSLPTFASVVFNNPIRVLALRMRDTFGSSARSAAHTEQLKCLISELEDSVHEGAARLPLTLQRDTKARSRMLGPLVPKLEPIYEEKAHGPYWQVAGEC